MIGLLRIILYSLLRYLSGSILYAPIWARILHTKSITDESKDHNPGVANAFTYGGFTCGSLTLLCELFKGIIPVQLYLIATGGLRPMDNALFALVLAAPVIGHIFPVFNGFRGGKGIAVTFGCLLGILPVYQPVIIMAASFIFFSVIIKVSPHFYRTAVSYLIALPLIAVFSFKAGIVSVALGFIIISAAVGYKLFSSPEEREKVKVSLLWMH